MKYYIKLKILTLLLCLSATRLWAQSILDVGIFNAPVGSDKLEVRVRPTQQVSNGTFSAGVFTVRFLSSYGVTISAPAALNIPLFSFSLANQGTDGTYQYYSFSFVSVRFVDWAAGMAYPLAILQIHPGCGSGDGTFEVINNIWTENNNGDVYLELNFQSGQNIIYQPSATAPLGIGVLDTIPPTIICPSNKTVPTDNNQCIHYHSGSDWDAIGSDNCPGYTIRYILSGATNDTLYTLVNANFNKGLTNINVTVEDGAGLSDTCAFSVTVNDVEVPFIQAPAAVTVMANASSCSAAGVMLGNPVVSDNCPNYQVGNNAPSLFPLGSTMVTWTITDAAGLTTTATQNVTVQSNLVASALNLSVQQICSGEPVNLSFTLSGGVSPYMVVYSANGSNFTVNGYLSNQAIPISPVATTMYKLLSVTDAIGCVVSPQSLSDMLQVKPNPSLSGLLPSATGVCQGESVSFTATGLLPNETTTFNYTLQPGGSASLTAIASIAGTYTFAPATQPLGVYGMSIQSVTVNGCTSNFSINNSATYTVSPFPTISSIVPSDTIVCVGTQVLITATGLPPNVNATFNYTLNGTQGTETVLTVSTGTANLLSAIYPEGSYTVVINTVTIGGCSVPVNFNTQFLVDPFQPMCGFTVAGRLATEKSNKGIEEAKVTISGLNNSVPFTLTDFTDTSGTYSLVNTIPLASSYQIKPFKNDNPLNGLTTYDLVLISKHILGIELLKSPYNMIAADANKSSSITTFDIVEFRKLILGIYQNLPNNNSWRFVDRAYVFPDTNNPFVPVFPEVINRSNIQMNTLHEDFIAIKVGDVNSTVEVNASPISEDRGKWPVCWMNIQVPSSIQNTGKVKAGEVFELAFSSDVSLAGYQFTLDLDQLEVLDIIGSEGMNAENFAVFPDAITGSFVSRSGQTGAFSVRFRAKAAGELSRMLRISSRITPAEAYSEDQEMTRMDLRARFEGIGPVDHPVFELYQNQPNPFSGSTAIPFYLPVADEVKLSLYDARGALVYVQQNRFDTGLHAFYLEGTAIPQAGMLYYKVENSTNSAVKMMLRE